MADSHYQQALDYIYSFVDYEKEPRPRDPVHYDLKRTAGLLARLGNPHLKARTIHITGSKGKGSVAAMIASVLTTSGYRTGLYTSPHLFSFNERIKVDDRFISDEEVAALVEKLKPEVAAINEKATYGRLTTFEVITALGFSHFASKEADFQVVEVGLGGRLDATNVVQPAICILTSISLDHTEVLGSTLAEITREKVGIIKSDSPVVTAPQDDEVASIIAESCRNHQAKLVKVDSDVTWQNLGFDFKQQGLRVQGRRGSYEFSIPLLGEHQAENAAVAIATLEILVEKGFSISRESITRGLAQVNWPGRLQVLSRQPLLIVDGAHSPASVQKLVQALKQHFDFGQAILIIGTSWDKDIAGIIAELAPVFTKAIVTHSTHPRATPPAAISAELSRFGITAQETDDIADALRLAFSQARENDLICVTGSLFIAAEAIEQAKMLCPIM